MPNFCELIDVFGKAREFIRLEGNDFSWSGWEDACEATSEIDSVLSALRDSVLPSYANVLFLPTGPLQELSLSSGWGDEFCWLADWYDEAVGGTDCGCYDEPTPEVGKPIGSDSRFADVFAVPCPSCRRVWLRYHYEFEAMTNSGRWFLGPLRRDQVEGVIAEEAPATFERMLWYFAGGSYFGGEVTKRSGRLPV